MSSDDVPPGAQCSAEGCAREALDPMHPAGRCPEHEPSAADDRDDSQEFNQQNGDKSPAVLVNDEPHDSGRSWTDAEFTDPERGQWAPRQTEFDQWMCRQQSKAPYAPWTDVDAPVECSRAEHDDPTTCAECGHHAGYKWGSDGSREHVHSDHESAREWAEKDARLSEDLVFIQREADPFAFVDGDDVRCPETGEVHPAFEAILEHLGVSYADISTSGAGAHVVYTGELPIEGKGEADFEIDTEPWGENDEPPTVEFYANKHVCIATGKHVPGSGTEVNQWDENALRAILQANGYEDKEQPSPDAEDIKAEYDGDSEYTDDWPDVEAAEEMLSHLNPNMGYRKWRDIGFALADHFSSHRARRLFEQWSRGATSYDAEAAKLIKDITSRDGSGVTIGTLIHEAQGGGWEPDFPDRGGVEHSAVLPPAVRDLSTTTTGWDWRHAAETADDDTLTVDDARERTVDAIADAYTSGDRVLVEALPTMGKSYGAVKAAADTDQQVTVLTGRGHKEQYQQFREWCDEHGLDYYTLPSFTRDCDTANGEHGEEWAETVRGWYTRGATPKEIHRSAEYETGRPLPCQEHEGQRCPYTSKWDFDPDEYDVLIGHYNHGHKSKVTAGRAVVFDEFPSAYETTHGPGLQGAVSYWLQSNDGVPFDSYTDLVEHRTDESRRAEALLWFDENGLEPDETHVFDDVSAHAAAPLLVFTLLASDDLGNGVEQVRFNGDTDGIGVFNRASGEVSLLQPPELRYASSVVALDGTPTQRMWELALGERLNHRPVLQDGERTEYIRDALNLNLVRTTEYVKPYNSADHVNTDADAALFETITEKHGDRPSVITTSTAEHEYDADAVLKHVDETKHYGNVLGSNEFDDTRLGAVVGSNHYGDQYIKKWGAYAGEAVERDGGKGEALSYTGFGDDVLQHMREHDTLQAAMRFGRDGNGAVVYVHTDTLPQWVPVAGEGRVVTTWSDGRRQVLDALQELDGAVTTAEVAAVVDVCERQVLDHLEALRDRGVLNRHQDPDDGRRVVWRDDGVHRLSDHGDVELETVSVEDLTTEEVHELARSSIYTWEFVNREELAPPPGDTPAGGAAATDESGATRAATPPDPDDPPAQRHLTYNRL